MSQNNKSVTIAIVETENCRLGRAALDYSISQFNCADVLVFSDQTSIWKHYDVISIPKIERIEEYNKIITSGLVDKLTTDYVLVIQYDGFVTNGAMFTPIFFEYDYIGAPWHQYNHFKVGNGGFSLRSRRLLELVKYFPYSNPTDPEDVFICRTIRDELEKCGVFFAPEKVAKHFSFEYPVPNFSTFGFHGVFNLPAIYANGLDFLVSNLSDRTVSTKFDLLYPNVKAVSEEGASLLKKRRDLLIGKQI